MEKRMTEYDQINQEASVRYNAALQEGRYEEVVRQLGILSEIAEKENRPRDKKRLEKIAHYICEVFHLHDTTVKMDSAETKKGLQRSMLAQEP